MEPKEVSSENERLTKENIDIAFDRLEEKDIEFCSLRFKEEGSGIDKDSIRDRSKNIIELDQQEDIYPLEEIFIEGGLIPKGSHFSLLDISILKKKEYSKINPLDFCEVVLTMESSKILLKKEDYPNIAESFPSLLGLSLNFGTERLRCISHHEQEDTILEAKKIFGDIKTVYRNFSSIKYTNKDSHLKKVEIEEIRGVIENINDIIKQKEEKKEFTSLEIQFINWAVEVLERKGIG